MTELHKTMIIIFLSSNRPSDLLRSFAISLKVSLLTVFYGEVAKHLSS